MTRFVFVVGPRDEGWVVQSSERVLERHTTGAEAVDAAIRWARANQPSVLMVKGNGGSVEHCRSFGSDPAEQVPGADGGLGIEGSER